MHTLTNTHKALVYLTGVLDQILQNIRLESKNRFELFVTVTMRWPL